MAMSQHATNPHAVLMRAMRLANADQKRLKPCACNQQFICMLTWLLMPCMHESGQAGAPIARVKRLHVTPGIVSKLMGSVCWAS